MGFMSKGRKKGKDDKGKDAIEEPPVSEDLDPADDGEPVGPESDDVIDEAGLLAQYTEAPAPAEAPVEGSDDLPQKAPDPPPPLPSPVEEPAGDGVSDDLMDIFAAEEEEDVTMTALADNLEEIDSHALLAHAIDVQTELREFVAGLA